MVPPSDRPEFVHEELRTLIIQGRLAPGARVIEQEIAARLGVSRTPVRTALARLQQEGLLTPVRAGTGTALRPVVTPLTRQDGEEVFQLMGALESLAGRQAAGLDRDNRLRLADELKVLNAEFRRAAERRRGLRTPVDADADFHRKLVEGAGGPRLRALHAVMQPLSERYERVYLAVMTDAMDDIEDDHLAIIRAVRDGDAADSQRAVLGHWRNAAERLRWAMQAGGERGVW